MKHRSILSSFRASFEGLRHTYGSERNFRTHLSLASLAVVLAAILGLSSLEWVLLLVAIGLVLALELINTAVEQTLDLVIKIHHPQVKIIKDVMAATVLMGAITALALGAFMFIPKILALIFP